MNLEQDTQTPMLGGALGAMFPFLSGAMAEHGIEYGTYALNESPLLLDRFARQTGYCAMVIGKLGAGKSFSTKLQLLRRAMHDQDTVLVMLSRSHRVRGSVYLGRVWKPPKQTAR